jgi:flagellar motor switch protein FliN/FliY
VSPAPPGVNRELFDELSARLGSALETMTGLAAAVTWDPLPFAPEVALRWRQPLPPLPGAVWLFAAAEDVSAAGAAILKAAGVDQPEPAEQRSTYLEIASQALAGLARALGVRLRREVTLTGGGETDSDPPPARWAELNATFGEGSFTAAVGIEDDLLAALSLPEGASPLSAIGETAPIGGSKTFELLLDVELPVSVSFGRAQIPLRDVIKLTTGSIVELNRSVTEPVEIIVNNCVIARGEVVVVEGNFGVRIQEVISRQERLRTLQ